MAAVKHKYLELIFVTPSLFVQLAELSSQLSSFQGNLETFAREHKQEIRKDPEFRRHFQEMCSSIGVDPLASGKGFWSNMLDIGDFYYELGVQIVEVCMASAHKTGGLMELGELRQKLVRARSADVCGEVKNYPLFPGVEEAITKR